MALKFTSNELVEIGRRVQDARVAKRMTQEYVCRWTVISGYSKNGQIIRYGRGLLSV